MKKLFLGFALLSVIAFSLPASASAATNPGVKPGSFFYFFDTTFDQISLFFTFSPEKKAEKALAYADERLAEAEAVAGDNNAEAIKTVITNYESSIALAAEKSKEVQDKEKAENLFTLIADNTSKSQEVLSAVLIKVPEEAKGAITRAIEASKRGQEEATQQIAELKGEVEQLRKEVAELKEKSGEQEKTIDELGKQKTKAAPTPITQNKPTTLTPQNQENTQTIKTQTPQTPSQQTSPAPATPTPVPVVQSTPTETLEITSVSVVPDMTSAKIEWQTNKPTESKVFVSGGTFSNQPFISPSGLSTRHSANISVLSAETLYYYEIEAIEGGSSVTKKNGNFKTLSLPPPPPSPPPYEVVEENLGVYSPPTVGKETFADYVFYNDTNKYIGYTSAKVKIWKTRNVAPEYDYGWKNALIRLYLIPSLNSSGKNLLSPPDVLVPISEITGTSEDTANVIEIPISGGYCTCDFMVMPTARYGRNGRGVAAYLRFETWGANSDEPLNEKELSQIPVEGGGSRHIPYITKLVSFEGEKFGTKETQTNSGVVYTF